MAEIIQVIQAAAHIGWPGALVSVVALIVGGWILVTFIKHY